MRSLRLPAAASLTRAVSVYRENTKESTAGIAAEPKETKSRLWHDPPGSVYSEGSDLGGE